MSAAFMTGTEVAARLGVHPTTFRRNRADLYRAGFPRPNPVMGRYPTADVEAWIDRQSAQGSPGEQKGVNHAAL